MISYTLPSEDVKVFPFGTTRGNDPYARVLNEQNITNLVRMLTDKKSYVVSFDADSKVMEFVIYGYYFKTDLTELWPNLDSDISNVYAYISIASFDDYCYIEGGDVVNPNSEFHGVRFTQYEVESEYKLRILKCENGATFEVPAESFFKFDSSSISSDINEHEVDVIYCGDASNLV